MVSKKRGNSAIKSLIHKGLICICIFALIFLMFLGIKYSGYVINTISRVTVDVGIIVIYNNFSGSTTDFLYLNDSQLAEIENMTLEVPLYGKIIFNEKVNLTEDVVNNTVDLDSNVFILNNSIEINTSALTSLEKRAILYLYGLNFTNPRILRNGEVCPDSICERINYSNGELSFDITGFSGIDEYSSEETPVLENPLPGSTGGGGGGIASEEEFSLDKNLIKVSIIQGESKRENLTIKNIGVNDINIELKPINISKFMVLSPVSFTLKARESRTINIDIYAKDDEIPDSYFGYIIVKGPKTEKYVNVIIDIKKKKSLFDISTSVIEKNVVDGSKVKANISLINKGDLTYMDVVLYYSVKTFDGGIIISKEESIAIEKELLLEREFVIPKGTVPGDYLFYAKVFYGNESATSSDNFKVIEKESPFSPRLILLILGIFVTIIIITILIILVLTRRFLVKSRHLSSLKSRGK